MFHGEVELKFITSVLWKSCVCFMVITSLVIWSGESQQQSRAKLAMEKQRL